MINSRTWRAVIGLAVASLLLLPDCGTIFSGGDQGVPVTSYPPGANVYVDGKASGQTPAYLRIGKHDDSVIRIEYPGYDPVEIRPKRKMAAFAVVGDILIGGALGLLIVGLVSLNNDYANGGKTALIAMPLSALGIIAADAGMGGVVTSPTELVVNLKKAEGGARAADGAGGMSGSAERGSPQVQTIFLDRDQFKNLKWIRVHLD